MNNIGMHPEQSWNFHSNFVPDQHPPGAPALVTGGNFSPIVDFSPVPIQETSQEFSWPIAKGGIEGRKSGALSPLPPLPSVGHDV